MKSRTKEEILQYLQSCLEVGDIVVHRILRKDGSFSKNDEIKCESTN